MLLLSVSSTIHAALDIEFHGIGDDDTLEQLRVYLGEPEGEGDADIEGFRDNIAEQGARALQAVGYYDASLSSRLEIDGDDQTLHIDVKLGQPVLLEQPDLRIDGPAAESSAFQSVLADSGLKAGDRLDHSKYEALKGRLLDLSQERGYFDAAFTTTRLEIDAIARRATARLYLASGPRYRIGSIDWDQPPIDPDRLQAWLPLEVGEPYEASRIASTHNALLDAGYFQNIRVRVLREEAANGEVPVKIEFQPRDENEIGLGLGYATDTGMRGRISWTRPHVGRRGHSLYTELYLSEIGYHATARYRIPDAARPQTHYDQFEAGSKHEEVEDTVSTVSTVAYQRVALLDNNWQRTLSLRFERESFDVAEDHQNTDLLLPGVAFSRTYRIGKLYAERGRRYAIRTAVGREGLGSDLDLIEVIANAKWLYSFTPRDILIARGEVGALEVSDFNRLSTSHRFYAGGDQSVRGYPYKSLGPEDADGDLIGGHYLTTASIEYAHYFGESWGLAVFSDAGRAFSDGSEPLHVGAGFGFRWRSPVGPLRIDIGFPLDDTEYSTPRLHLSIGPEL